MLFAAIIFVFSLLAIAGLFTFRYWELQRGFIVAPALREKLDVRAVQLKELVLAARADLAKLPPLTVRIGRIMVHEAALALAALARIAERQAHRLADLVSHKHRFERRETRSEFLKKVSEHKEEGSE